MSIAHNLLQHLSKVKSTGPNKWIACCPAHDDRSPSMGVRELDDGRLIIHCFSGCSVEEIVRSVGLRLNDLFPPNGVVAKRINGKIFPASDVLQALEFESRIIMIAAMDILNGKPVSKADFDRISVAYKRIELGVNYGKS